MEFCTKAVVLKAFGSYNSLSIERFPLPSLDQKVEVEVHYCGMNFADLYTRQGLMNDRKPPFVLGIECSGIIKDIGDLKECFLQIGQKVICYDYQGGFYQDVIRVSPDKCYPLPDDISLKDGAAILVNYLTAYFSLFYLGNLKPNENVLIQSCGGGVGCAATQLAKTIKDVTIIGSTSQFKRDAVEMNGVDHVVGYENVIDEIKSICPEGLDLIIENQAGKTFESLQHLLKPLGRIVLIGANNIIQNDKKLSVISLFKAWWNLKEISPTSLLVNNRSVSGLHLGILAEQDRDKMLVALDVIFNLMREDKIKPLIDSVWPIEDVVKATKVLAGRKNVGKVLLIVNEESLAKE